MREFSGGRVWHLNCSLLRLPLVGRPTKRSSSVRIGTRESSPAFDDEVLWQDSTKGGWWDELVGTLVVVSLIAAGVALLFVG